MMYLDQKMQYGCNEYIHVKLMISAVKCSSYKPYITVTTEVMTNLVNSNCNTLVSSTCTDVLAVVLVVVVVKPN